MIPRGKYLGERVGDPPKGEAEHFVRAPKQKPRHKGGAGLGGSVFVSCHTGLARVPPKHSKPTTPTPSRSVG